MAAGTSSACCWAGDTPVTKDVAKKLSPHLVPAYFNMIVARYCRRPAEHAATMRVAKLLFKDANFLAHEADRIKPGELPGG